MRRTIPIDPATAASLATRRRNAGLSQNQVALELGVSEAAISHMETARTPVSAATRAAIEEAITRLASERIELAS